MFSHAEGEGGLQGNFFLFSIDKRLGVVYTDYSTETNLYYLIRSFYEKNNILVAFFVLFYFFLCM